MMGKSPLLALRCDMHAPLYLFFYAEIIFLDQLPWLRDEKNACITGQAAEDGDAEELSSTFASDPIIE